MLLSGEYTTGLDLNNIEHYIKEQYHNKLVDDKKSWKVDSEHWPNNLECKNTPSDKPKLFLACNPTLSPYFINKELQYIINDTKVILLYSDLRTQLRMSYDKQAYWFSELSRGKFNRSFYSNQAFIRKIINSGVLWKDELCDPELPKIEKIFPNLETVNLRDLLQNYPKNPKQQWLIDRWLSLHTTKELRHLL
jgi:hypothetical protein